MADGGKRAWERPRLIRLDVDRATHGGVYPNVYETGHVAATTHTSMSGGLGPSNTVLPGYGAIS